MFQAKSGSVARFDRTVCPCDDTPVVSPVGLVQDDDLVSSFGQRDFLLSKHLDLVSHHIDSPADTTATVTVDVPARVHTTRLKAAALIFERQRSFSTLEKVV